MPPAGQAVSGRVGRWFRLGGPRARHGHLGDVRSDDLACMAGVDGVARDGDARVDAFPAAEGARVVVNGDLFHELEPAFLLPLGRYALEGREGRESPEDFSDAKALFWQAFALGRFVPLTPNEPDETGEGEACFVAPGKDGGEDGQGGMCGD